MMRSSVDRPGVKPLCCGRCFAKIVLFIRARHMWAKTLAGTERSDMPRYLVQSDFGPFSFPEWKNYGDVPVSGDDTVFPDEYEKRK